MISFISAGSAGLLDSRVFLALYYKMISCNAYHITIYLITKLNSHCRTSYDFVPSLYHKIYQFFAKNSVKHPFNTTVQSTFLVRYSITVSVKSNMPTFDKF